MNNGWLAPTLLFAVLVALMPFAYGSFKKRIRESPVSDDHRARLLRLTTLAEYGALAIFGTLAVVCFAIWLS